jgi:DNA invertase Pin-like site-specific DNA recombinase
MTTISSALQNVRRAVEALAAEQAMLRRHVQSILQGGGRAAFSRGRAVRGTKKRGRAFKFTDDQAAEVRKQVEGGKSAAGLAKELKVSLPTMYNTLKRAGWTGRRGRPARTRRSIGNTGPKKRGRAFKFSDAQAAELRKQVEGGKSALALAKELKISPPTMYNTLKRVGWAGRKGRKARAA